jgi:hypothetical protein
VHNASGFGFNGFDENDQPKWDLLDNVNIMAIEKSTSIKGIIDNWNMQTSKWMRAIAFERLTYGKTFGVFVLSAVWHGFYPGYYITFALAACLVYIGRGVIKKILDFSSFFMLPSFLILNTLIGSTQFKSVIRKE